MIVVDEYIVYNWDADQYESFGIHYNVHIYKHFHNPLITIFDRGAKSSVITFKLEEFESLVTLNQMLPIYAREVFSYIDDFVWYSLSDDEPYNFKVFLEMERDHPFIEVARRYEPGLKNSIMTFLKAKVEAEILLEATLNEVFHLIKTELKYEILPN